MAISQRQKAVRTPENKRLMQQEAPKPIRIVCPGPSPAAPQTCLPITPCPTSCDAHDVGECIVWRERAGRPGFGSRQRMSMRLGAARGISGLSVARRFAVIAVIFAVPAAPRCDLAITMCMAWHLLNAQRRSPDSAGQTRSCPPQTAPAAGSGRPHDVRKGIIRRQGGRLPRCSIQRVRMGLRVTDGAGGCGRLPDTRSPATKTARGIPRTSHCMSVAGQLLYRERGLADSAGQIF